MRTIKWMLAIAILLLAACGGENNYSPTAPPAPPPAVRSLTANYTLDLYDNSGAGVEEVQVLLDGVVLCTGTLSPWDYGGACDSGDLGILAVGRHTLGVKVTRQKVSPTNYHVSASVFGASVFSQRVSWEEAITLTTGDAWTGVFEIRE